MNIAYTIAIGVTIIAGVIVFFIEWADFKNKKIDMLDMVGRAIMVMFIIYVLATVMSFVTLDAIYRYQKGTLFHKNVDSQNNQIEVISEYSILRPFILSIETQIGGNKKWNAD